jgi:hypothetical protein
MKDEERRRDPEPMPLLGLIDWVSAQPPIAAVRRQAHDHHLGSVDKLAMLGEQVALSLIG